MRHRKSGQATLEYAILTVAVIIPTVFGIIFLAQLLWVWHSAVEWTRDGARYASTHCWQANGANVLTYMSGNVPVNIDQSEFQSGPAQVLINFYSHDPNSGALIDFSCDTECSSQCVPDVVTVQVTGYQFTHFMGYLKLPPVTMPPFLTSLPVEGAGCDPEQGVCTP